MRAGQPVEYEGDVGGPALVQLGEERVVLLEVARGAGGDAAAGEGDGVCLVRVVDPDHDVAVTGEVLGQPGQRAARFRVAGGQDDQRQAVRPPGRPGVEV